MEFLAGLVRVQGSYAGVSVGVDRLLMALLGKEAIGDVLYGRFRMI
jgi:elongation factor P--beta-lysine ligase